MDPFSSRTEYSVAYADTDQMGVVYYANFLVMFERARTRFLQDLGYPYTEFEADGFMLPVVEAHVDYLQPALYEDVLTLSATAEFIGRVRVKINCRVHRGDTLLAKGHTIHVCMDKAKSRPAKFPARLMQAHQEFVGE